MKVKEESEKAGWKLSLQKTKIMASGPITSWQIDGKTMETMTEFIWGGKSIKRFDSDELWCWRIFLSVPWTAGRSNQSILKEISCEYSLERLMLKLKLQQFAYLTWRTDCIRKDLDAGKDGRQEEKGMTEDEMVGWHHWLDGHELEQALGVGDGQGSLARCSPWGHKESDMSGQLYWTEWKMLEAKVRLTPVFYSCWFFLLEFISAKKLSRGAWRSEKYIPGVILILCNLNRKTLAFITQVWGQSRVQYNWWS